MKFAIVLLAISLTLPACSSGTPGAAQEIPSPASMHSAQPNLAAGPDGETYVSWIEVADSGMRALKFARRTDESWSEPQTLVEGNNLLLNWADFPSLLPLPDKTLAAHWLTTDAERDGYNINVAFSRDNGQTWSTPITPHTDGTATEHGFVSLLPAPGGGVSVLWLDSRKLAAGGTDDVAMMNTSIGLDGARGTEREVDARVCECCSPSSVHVSGSTLAVYRDRSSSEVRDIAIVRLQGTEWSQPKIVHEDNWEIYACPINGPAIAAAGDTVAVAWFTAPAGKPKAYLSFSKDGGNTFGEPVQVDDGNPTGRVDVALLESGTAVVTWIEHASAGGQVRARQIDPDGRARPSFVIGPTSVGTASGFPRVERSGGGVVFAWTDTDKHQVRTAQLTD
jgi:hypothetical protein